VGWWYVGWEEGGGAVEEVSCSGRDGDFEDENEGHWVIIRGGVNVAMIPRAFWA
jgi:hypothetical protein